MVRKRRRTNRQYLLMTDVHSELEQKLSDVVVKEVNLKIGKFVIISLF